MDAKNIPTKSVQEEAATTSHVLILFSLWFLSILQKGKRIGELLDCIQHLDHSCIFSIANIITSELNKIVFNLEINVGYPHSHMLIKNLDPFFFSSSFVKFGRMEFSIILQYRLAIASYTMHANS